MPCRVVYIYATAHNRFYSLSAILVIGYGTAHDLIVGQVTLVQEKPLRVLRC